MYIATIPNRNSPPAILLRESVRQGKKINKKIIANLSHWTPERILALKRALRGDFDQLPEGIPVNGPIFGLLSQEGPSLFPNPGRLRFFFNYRCIRTNTGKKGRQPISVGPRGGRQGEGGNPGEKAAI